MNPAQGSSHLKKNSLSASICFALRKSLSLDYSVFGDLITQVGSLTHIELVFTRLAGLHAVALHCLSLPGFVPSLLSYPGSLVGRAPAV